MFNSKRLLSILFAASTVLFTPELARAEEPVCTGVNMLVEIEKDDPELMAKLRASADAVPNGKGLLWKVEKQGVQPSYLFGTMHLSDPRLLNLSPNAQKAFDTSTSLTLEITEILDPNVMAAKAFKIVQMTSYFDGQTISAKLDESILPALKKRVTEVAGLPWIVADKMRPWALMGAVALPACEFARKRAGKPFLDIALGQQAKQQGKTVLALETLEGQLNAMAGLPEKSMLTALKQTIQLGPRLEDMFETMIVLYKREEMGMLWAILQNMNTDGVSAQDSVAAYAEFQRSIIDQRNANMAVAAKPMLDKGGAFIAVGALHLPGEMGLVHILRQQGYTIIAQ